MRASRLLYLQGRAEPLRDLAGLVPNGHGASLKPAVFAGRCFPQAIMRFDDVVALGDGFGPFFCDARSVLGMHVFLPIPVGIAFEIRLPGKIEPAPVKIIYRAVGVGHHDQDGHCVG